MSMKVDNTYVSLVYLSMETWFYFTNYAKDGWPMKLLVVAVLCSDTVHQALITHTADKACVVILLITEKKFVEVLFNGLTALMVQSFLAWRIWKLSNGCIWRTGSVMVLVVGEFVCVAIYVAKAINFETFAQLMALKSLSMTVNAVAAAGDILITACLCHLLHGVRASFLRSENLINKLIIFTINTGLLTSFCAIASLLSIAAAPDTFIYIAFYFCLGRLYCNSLLATLNVRRFRRENAWEDIPLSSERMSNRPLAADALALQMRC
ncbi:hypothetical protein CONPUDRAFT_73858 [Coniophora puteana RWD-64-598 SS2]|uniref:DUF6534 domain-containing protein n=1 Tax=Coniophora puteana (strain RWD-64-598) TaxID=741705 RepID=A0A5M3MNV1_CONPW|nr:uncharacterized protein CONPUDRAFT_73858 [Coniophora puteana RWD-64-598 SS2]EIW80838.1 hypothetical protein CONPUDRAFT_73858 [Coniophora puteana RWD-64-598 SS2]